MKVPKTKYCHFLLKFKSSFLIGLVITPPENLIAAVKEDSIELTFRMRNTTGIKYYEIELKRDKREKIVETNSNSESYVITNLVSDTEYEIRMRAVTHDERKSKWSRSITKYICKLYRREDQVGIRPLTVG